MDNNEFEKKEQQEILEEQEAEIIAVLPEIEEEEEAKPVVKTETQEEDPFKKPLATKVEKKQTGISHLTMGIIGAIIGGLLVAFIVPSLMYGKFMPYSEMGNGQGQQIVISPEKTVTVASAVAKKNMPAVVRISTVSIESDIFLQQRTVEGVGSGAIVNSNGYILTNAHVVGTNPEKITVDLQDGRELAGKVLWIDSVLDLAVVKVNVEGLPVVEMADSDYIDVGETAIAIGNPLGTMFERTVTQGIVSGLNRSIMVGQGDLMEDLIQTDAAINPGNSGGPLINSRGQVMGINTVKASAEGLGFAIPINIAKPIIAQLVEKGSFTPTYVGISAIDREMAGYYKTEIKVKNGLYIESVKEGAPAALAGLKPADIITKVDGVNINTMVKFKSMLYAKKAGEKVTVTYIRGGFTHTAEITLADMPKAYK